MPLEFRLNGASVSADVRPHKSLADTLREDFGLTGTHLGCEQGVCGACTVLLDGAAVRSCMMVTAQAEGREVTTVEGAVSDGPSARLPEKFLKHRAFQCGFCTPGMVVTLTELLHGHEPVTRADVAALLSGNICRCTGYQPIIDAACEILAESGLLTDARP